MEFDFLSFLLGIVVGAGLSYLLVLLLGRMIYRKLEAAVEAAVDEQKEEANAKRIDMKVECHGNIIYAFRVDTDDFVCQGADLAEIKKNFIARFPGYGGAIVEIPDETLRKTLFDQRKELVKIP